MNPYFDIMEQTTDKDGNVNTKIKAWSSSANGSKSVVATVDGGEEECAAYTREWDAECAKKK